MAFPFADQNPGKIRSEYITPYASKPEFSDDRTNTPTSSKQVFGRKESPRIVSFTAGAKRRLRTKKRGMR